jgi:nucleoside-diphosphate-sugar epimerase
MPSHTALIVGAHGVIGSPLTRHLAAHADWAIITASRRAGGDGDAHRALAVDLLDRSSSRRALREAHEVTHVFYSAYQDSPTWPGLVGPNMTMLENLLDGLLPVADGLRHVSIMQGYKVYGAHLGPFRTPAREDDPPILPSEFMTAQQGLLERVSQSASWTWSALRPAVVGGDAVGNPLNLALAIAVYASVCKALDLPLRFPGHPRAYTRLIEFTDAALLADASRWAATDAPGNQAWNIGNGDLVRWCDLWPRLAAWFGMDAAPPMALSLAEVMPDRAGTWDALRERHGLPPLPMDRVAAWPFADFVFSWTWDMFGDGSKARRAGFHAGEDTAVMFFRLFAHFRSHGVIP